MRTYEQLLVYLKEKAPPGTIKTAELGFEGRATVLYMEAGGGAAEEQRGAEEGEGEGDKEGEERGV